MHAANGMVFVLGLALAAGPSTGAAEERDSERTGLGRLGGYALVGGGVNDFTRREARDRFDVGGVWHLRLGIGNRSYVGGELAYVGSARSTANGAGSDLLSSGAEAVLRLQYPWERGSWLVQPFAFGGIGWSHLSLRDAPPGVKDSDQIGAVPFGGGVTLGYRRVLLDARFTYRATFGEDLALAAGGGTPRLDQWGATASVGYEF